jgi:beta-galactosidase/beta-glucuronidase
LNGPWDFLFDDEDMGLISGWHVSGLPNSVAVQDTRNAQSSPQTERESITTRITGSTQKLSQGNLTPRAMEARTHHKRKINVPFVFQSPASGINERAVHEVLWYERHIQGVRTDDERNKKYRLLVRFGAVDYKAKVWVDGQYVGGHRGGQVPWDVDITDAVEQQNSRNHRLTLRVYDSAYDLTQPRGKQYWGAKPESIFYTPSSGIWQSVWMESVPSTRIADSSHGTILRSNDIQTGTLRAKVAILGRRAGYRYSIAIEARFAGLLVSTSEKKELPKDEDYVNVDINLYLSQEQQIALDASTNIAPTNDESGWRNGLALWSPEYPQLYDLRIRLFDSSEILVDEVETTIGMRSLNWSNNTFRLNDTPIFQALCLDQGYWPESFMTPPSSTALKADIEMAKRMGFNGCRKHQKVEDPLFLYWADRLGYLVWGEMANAYSFSDEYVDRFNAEWIEAVKRDINHPSVVVWTPVNESWAYTDLANSVVQRNHIRALYYMTK